MSELEPVLDEKRISELSRYQILDTPKERVFDELVSFLAESCDAPVAYVSFIDRERQWFKSVHGAEFQDLEIQDSFCSYTILGDDILEIPDARQDPRFLANRFVTPEDGIRFYAGYPLISPNGYALGTVCVIDTKPRQLSDFQRKALNLLGQQIMSELDTHLRIIKAEQDTLVLQEKQRTIEEQNEELIDIMGQLQDLNQRLAETNVEMGEIVAERNQELNTFLYRASHDLSRPISSIQGLAMVGAMKSEGEEAYALFGEVKKTAQDMKVLLNSLLIIHELQQTDCVSEGEVAWNDVYALAQKQVQKRFPEAVWGFSLESSQPMVSSPRLWEIILEALLSNAWVYRRRLDEVPQVSLSVKVSQALAEVWFQDDGVGVLPEAKDKVFDMFYRGNQRSKGNGLGLYIVDRAIRLMKGEVDLQSQLGMGTAFRFVVPVK